MSTFLIIFCLSIYSVLVPFKTLIIMSGSANFEIWYLKIWNEESPKLLCGLGVGLHSFCKRPEVLMIP